MVEKIKIKIKNLNFYYSDFQALKNINLNIEQNKITALIGPSGCGKTTFLRTLNRMNDLIDNVRIEGEVLFNNKNIYDKNIDLVDLRKKIGMVFQKPNPFPFSIFDNVAYGPKMHGVKDKKKLKEIVEKSLIRSALFDEVKDKLKKNAFDLSGGQQQRLCIARVLAVEPEVILFDEPCSALDPTSTLKIEQLMVELKKEIILVIVTHNMQQAARVSDHTGFFLHGELIEFDETSKVFSKPRHKITEEYITGRFG
jgi:phosphate transport system ATP-binding protein